MPRLVASVVALLLHLAAPLLMAVGFAFTESELPALPVRGTICVFPLERLNPLSLLQGAAEPEVDAFFGVQSAPTPERPQNWCVRYKYSPRLAYTLLFRGGMVESIRLTEGDFTPFSCEGILVKVVEVPRRAWYASAVPPRKNRCACPPWGASSCAVAAEEDVSAAEAQS